MISTRRWRQAARHPLKAGWIAAAFLWPGGITRKIRLPGNRILHLALPDYVCAVRYLTGHWEPEVEAFLAATLKPGMTAFDVGAHVGLHALEARQRVGAQGRVVCFEPVPPLFQVLQSNLAGFANVSLEALAINDGDPANVSLKYFGKYHAGLSTAFTPRTRPNRIPVFRKPVTITAAAVSIDAYVQKAGAVPDLIKLDIEGGEMAALRGAAASLRDFKPHVILEVGDTARTSENSSRECLDFLDSLGYQFHEFSGADGRLRTHSPTREYPHELNLLCSHPQRGIVGFSPAS